MSIDCIYNHFLNLFINLQWFDMVCKTVLFHAQECVSVGAGLSIAGSGLGASVGGEMPGSFVPTVTAITTSQDLQWMVQPTLVSSQASGQSGSTGTTTMTQPVSLVDPYDMPGPSYTTRSGYTPPSSDTPGPAPGPSRQSRTRSRRTRDESVSDDGDVGVLVSVCLFGLFVDPYMMHMHGRFSIYMRTKIIRSYYCGLCCWAVACRKTFRGISHKQKRVPPWLL